MDGEIDAKDKRILELEEQVADLTRIREWHLSDLSRMRQELINSQREVDMMRNAQRWEIMIVSYLVQRWHGKVMLSMTSSEIMLALDDSMNVSAIRDEVERVSTEIWDHVRSVSYMTGTEDTEFVQTLLPKEAGDGSQ